MEKFFKVKKENKVYEDYFKWYNNFDNLFKRWEQFKKLTGIESTKFVPRKELYIIPTENDLNKFGKFFVKEKFDNGLRKFKASSTIQKDWERFIDNNNVIVEKPNISFDFLEDNCFEGKIFTRLFHYNKDVYCSIECKSFNENFKIPEGYEEIKGSEFYSIVEKIETEAEGVS